jgi:hypothetical protein
MTIGAATVFPFRHDFGVPFEVTREWRTDVMEAADGSEIRAALRTNPAIRVRTTIVAPDETAFGRVFAAYVGATEPLRMLVPLWCDATALTADASSGTDTLTADFTTRPFFETPGQAMLWTSETSYEIVNVDILTSTTLTLPSGETLAASWATGTRLVPLRAMWWTPETSALALGVRAGQVVCEFVDARDAVGAGASGGDAVAASPNVVEIWVHSGGQAPSTLAALGWPNTIQYLEARVRDANGIALTNVALTWTPSNPALVQVVPSLDTQRCRVQLDSATSSFLTAQVVGGGPSDTIALN